MSGESRALLSLTVPAGVAALVPVRLVATEAISSLFRFEIDAVAAQEIDPVSMLNKPACLAINHGGTPTRYFHGIVGEFGPIGRSGVVDILYRLVLVPQLTQAELRIDCRMFFDKTAEDILNTIFSEAGVTDLAFRLYSSPASRVATTQYNESCLHFVTRLMEEEGWFYFFEHARDKHTLVVTSGNDGFTTVAGADLKFGDGTAVDHLTAFRKTPALTHGKVSLRDYDPDVTTKQLKANKNTVFRHDGIASREVFHWPALTRETSQVSDRAKWRMEAAEAAVSLASAEGAMAKLVAGGKFKLKDNAGAETMQVVHSIRHFAEEDARRAGTGGASYSNSLTAFANTVPWRQPMRTARPRMEGLHTAIVLAPDGQEIHTDEQGRIKIRFFWDWREDSTADTEAWVRVIQPWAGNQWGGQFIPRVNTEVAVAFMDADPDRPVVVGGLYNGTDKPIFPVADKTKLGFRSRSVLKGGTDDFNEFSFDDKMGNEKVFLHAQKDLTTEVENDQALRVDHDRTVTVKGKETVTIKGDRTHEVTEGNEILTVKNGDRTEEISMGNDSLTVKMGNLTTDVKMGNISVKADLGAITVEGMQSITLTVGESKITVDQMGVSIQGMMIKVEGQIQTQVKGLMTDVSADAMLMVKGAITMIN